MAAQRAKRAGRAKRGTTRARATANPRGPSLPRTVVRSVAVVVSDRERSLAWYTERLGLDVIDRVDHWITVGRSGEGGALHLCQTSDYDPSLPAEQGNTGINLGVPGDFERECARLAANGVTFRAPATKAEWGWWATVVDPDGNEISLTPLD
jgi:catechol 2,3-dioxygenase-like lactoylglutathione lyase family enzyme